MNKNKAYLEQILGHLTKHICLMDFGEIKQLQKYVDMATSVSAQILACDEIEEDIETDEDKLDNLSFIVNENNELTYEGE